MTAADMALTQARQASAATAPAAGTGIGIGFEGVTVAYRGQVVLKDLSLTVHPGEILAIIGPSGSGKTTLLSMLGCILRPSAGTILVDGEPVSSLPESRLPGIRRSSFGFLFQQFHLFPFLTALENVETVMRLQRIPRQVRDLVGRAVPLGVPVGIHLHNTRNTGFANAYAALEAGATVFDASVGGIGGCPFAPRATGNIATEDLVYLFHGEGVETGIDLGALIDVAQWLESHLGRELEGQVYKAGAFAPVAS